MIRTSLIAVTLVAALAVALAAPLLAQEQPRFFIERIEVRENGRVSPEVIVAESRLREGTEYTEGELRDAAARLTRLPFLLTADFALERGSERGRHVLVITVGETRSFFYRFEAVPHYSDPLIHIDTASHLGNDETTAALGYRWFVGRRGALHAALIARESGEFTRGYSAVAVGYTAYDLFGTRAFATVNVKHSPAQDSATPQVVVGIPLSLNQTITAEYDHTRFDYDSSNEVNDESEVQRLGRVTWSYNTTNHPFLPTEGTQVSAGLLGAWRDESYLIIRVFPDGIADYARVPVHLNTIGIQGSAQRYWEISDRNSVSIGGEAGLGHVDRRERLGSSRYGALYGVVQAGFSRSLWSTERRAQGGDSRIELRVRGRAREGSSAGVRYDDDGLQANLSWVRHSSWGTIRLGAGYAW